MRSLRSLFVDVCPELRKMILFGENCLNCLAIAFPPQKSAKPLSNQFNALAKHFPFRDIHNLYLFSALSQMLYGWRLVQKQWPEIYMSS